MKYLLLFLSNSIISVLLFIYLYFSIKSQFPNVATEYQAYLLVMLSGIIAGCSLWYLNELFKKLWAWSKWSIFRLLSGVIAFTFLCIAIASVILPQLVKVNAFIQNKALPNLNFANIYLHLGILIFTIVFLFLLIDYFVFSYRDFLYHNVIVIERQREKSQLQLEMLQKQLSPHYLFNSLNTISNLIDDSAEKTELYIRKLVNTYRYILSNSGAELVTLADELKMIKAYQYQLEVRFGKSMKWNYVVADSYLEYLLPPLSLQILIENAVKHNIASLEHPLTLTIESNENCLVVENNITQMPEKMVSHKMGLSNLKRRYALLGNYTIEVVKGNTFIVKLPFIRKV